MAKKAFLVECNLITRIVIDEEDQDLDVVANETRQKFLYKVENELTEHISEWYEDVECPYEPEVKTFITEQNGFYIVTHYSDDSSPDVYTYRTEYPSSMAWDLKKELNIDGSLYTTDNVIASAKEASVTGETLQETMAVRYGKQVFNK